MPQVIDYEHGIRAIDSGYRRPKLDAIHLMVEGARAAIIDTGANHSVPLVLEAMRRMGLRPAPAARILEIYSHDVELNAQGLGFWLDSVS